MIHIKTQEEIGAMKEGGGILAGILKKLSEEVKPGITTRSLEEKARQLTKEAGAGPAFLGYNGYPAFLCVSINEEVVHCLPSEKKIIRGDLVSLDFGIKYKGFNVDSATTILTEPESNDPDLGLKKKLIETTQECLEKGIEAAEIGNTIGDISFAIQKHAEKNGFSVIQDLVGHGIGRDLHEDPEVPNFGEKRRGPQIVEGMAIAIEPMLSAGSHEVLEDKKSLAWLTKDNSLSAHFEHTVAITKSGPLVLTI
ncbi:MAG: type I methionyl aminopeptidase [Parcubacteria group bacterium]|nr:type I methionyl aminopeptidase [Parcubacteria group bacterium]